MSDIESDESLHEEEQYNNDEGEVYETVIKKGLDRKTEHQIQVKKPRTPAQIAATERMLAARAAKKKAKEESKIENENQIDTENQTETEPENPNKKISKKHIKHINSIEEAKKANVKITKKAVKKIKHEIKKEMPLKEVYREKVIYMIPTQDGFIQSDTIPRLTKNELKKMENDQIVTQKEIETGKKILRKKNGSEDQRNKPRSEKQLAHARKLSEMNKQRSIDKKAKKKEDLKSEIKSALIDVVSRPIDEVKKEIEPPKYNFDVYF